MLFTISDDFDLAVKVLKKDRRIYANNFPAKKFLDPNYQLSDCELYCDGSLVDLEYMQKMIRAVAKPNKRGKYSVWCGTCFFGDWIEADRSTKEKHRYKTLDQAMEVCELYNYDAVVNGAKDAIPERFYHVRELKNRKWIKVK